MRQTKRRIEAFSFFNLEGIRTHLEKMAAKGWMIEKLGAYTWLYQRCEPRSVHFAVSYFPKASEFDPEPTEEQQRFIDFCAHTSWKLACTSAQLQIFYNENEEPTPIETEPSLELDAIHASAKKSFLPAYVLLMFLGLMLGGFWISSLLGDIIGVLADPTKLFTGLCWLIVFLLTSVELLSYFLWYRKARVASEQGIFLTPPNTMRFQRMMLFFVAILFIYWLFHALFLRGGLYKWITILSCGYMLLLISVTNGTKAFLKRKKLSRGWNLTVTMLICFLSSFAMMMAITGFSIFASSKGYFDTAQTETYEYNGSTFPLQNDELPLTLEQLLEGDFSDYIRARRGDGSLFLSQYVMEERPRFDAEHFDQLPSMEYTIVEVKMPFLYEASKERMIYEKEKLSLAHELEPEYEYRSADAVPWKADAVYHLHNSESGFTKIYLLCYDNVLVEICFSWELTEEQMNAVGEVFNGK